MKRPIQQQQHINRICTVKVICNFHHLLIGLAGASVFSEIRITVFKPLRKVIQQPLIWNVSNLIASQNQIIPTCSSSLLTLHPFSPVGITQSTYVEYFISITKKSHLWSVNAHQVSLVIRNSLTKLRLTAIMLSEKVILRKT